MVILTICKSTKTGIELIPCSSFDDAKEKLNSMFNLLLHIKNCDPENTFCDEEEMYAQIAEGLEVTEMRIGTM